MLVRFFYVLTFYVSLSTVFLNTAGAAPSLTNSQELLITADVSDTDSKNETVDLQGNVQVIYKDQHLKSQRAFINYRGKTIDAQGDVLIVTPQANIGAKRVILDYESNTGIIYDGYVQSGSVLFEGAVLYKTGESEYIGDSARYTACTNCPETWSFTGKKIRAQIGGYAYIKNSTMKIGGVPVFWLPYLVVPLKSDRQTGLLTPEYERSGSGGNTFSQSGFWAISRSQDATVTLKNYELRGFKSLLNYRYVLNEHSSGEFNTAFLQDRVFANDERLNSFRSIDQKGGIVDRWFLKYDHYYELPDGFVHRAQLNNASDLQYPKDFSLETLNHGDPAMENRMSLTKNTDLTHWSVDSSYYVNLMHSNPLSSNEDAVHRLPEIRYTRAIDKIAESSFLYSWDVKYTNFARTNFAYDDLNYGYTGNSTQQRVIKTDVDPATCVDGSGNPLSRDLNPQCHCVDPDWDRYPQCHVRRDGAYDPNTDLLRSGQRLDAVANLYRPISAGKIDFLPSLSYHETQYRFSVGDDPTNVRRYVRTELAAKTNFNSVYELDSSDRIKHDFEPFTSFTTIPWIYHPSHPFFGAVGSTNSAQSQGVLSDDDLSSPLGLQFDYTDRLYDRKLITFGVLNKLTRKTWKNGQASYKQFVTWKLSQSYDAYQAENDNPKQAFSDVSSELKISLDHLELSQQANYFPYQQVTNSNTSIRLINDYSDFVELRYDIGYTFPPGQEARDLNRSEKYTLTLKKTSRLFDILGRVAYDINPPPEKENQRISSYGYGLQISLPGDCWSFTIIQGRPTSGDDVVKVNFDFSWEGKPRMGLQDSTLDRFQF